MAKPRFELDVIIETATECCSLSETAERLGTTTEKVIHDLRVHGVNLKDFKSLMRWDAELPAPDYLPKSDDSSEEKLELSEEEVLRDPLAILELLKEAILNRGVDKEILSKAVIQVLENYEFQNRLFLVAAANAELPRILKLLEFINSCEGEMFKPARVEGASNRELAKMYALAQTNLLTGLDRVKQVADMRLEMIRAGGGGDMGDLFRPTQALKDLAGVPALDSQGRDRVRKLLSGVLDIIDDDPYDTDEDDEDQ